VKSHLKNMSGEWEALLQVCVWFHST